jgi:hypothetical protein
MVLVDRPNGEVPDAVGLTPGVASSVAPIGIPVGATGEAGPTPRGEVMPRGEGPGAPPTAPTWAMADPEHKTASPAVTTNLAISAASRAWHPFIVSFIAAISLG